MIAATNLLARALRSHGGGAVFAWGVLKSLLPFPTPSVMMLAGTVRPEADAGAAFWPLVTGVALPGAAGIALGGLWYHRLARGPRFHAFARRLERLGLGADRLRRLEARLRRRRGPIICALRAVPFVPVIVGPLLAALADQPALEFLAWSFAGALVRCLALGYAGFYARHGVSSLLHAAVVASR